MMLPKSISLIISLCAISVNAFAPFHADASRSLRLLSTESDFEEGSSVERRSFLSSVAAAGSLLLAESASADDGEESFADIAARASKLSTTQSEIAPTGGAKTMDDKTAYDFELPFKGGNVPFKELIQQEFDEEGRAKIKAILVVNMKEDDPISRNNIPEFISLAAKYGRDGEFAVLLSPSDQGYYEPDTSQLIRLKLASEYGYGINPATVLTDKVIFLGTGSTPFWRWLQKNCRTPAGLGRIEANYEKFLLDGRTGLPLRRYPRLYKPLDIKNDIEALVNGRALPPAGANYLEQWRQAAVAAQADTYRFQKGLNYYDQ
ncbi:unnamed protein product [Cylindrotheca closterium]|uniref:Glutathione peroxidase n=1 Tax=Cylindrotheca closterium TaxID=2856 RepID=A0AAD2CG45_9STRA|nr:unnamed protein product [Cylindrotheca closterium]